MGTETKIITATFILLFLLIAGMITYNIMHPPPPAPDAGNWYVYENTHDNRVKFMMKHYDLTESKATQVVTNEDKRRQNLYRKLGKTDYDDASLYHLVLNMGRIDLDTAQKMVLELLKE